MQRRKNANSRPTTLCLDKGSIKKYRELGISNLSSHLDDLMKKDIESIIQKQGLWKCSYKECVCTMAWNAWQKNNFICPECKCDHYTRSIMQKVK